MKRSNCIILFLLVIAKLSTAGDIVVKANIRDVKLLNFYYNDVFFDLKSKMISRPDENGNFIIHADPVVYPAIVVCEFYGTHLPFLAFEGQTYILKRAADSTLYVENRGRNVSLFYNSIEKRTGSLRAATYNLSNAADAYSLVLGAERRKLIRDSMMNRGKLPESELNYFKQFFYYTAILDKLRPFMQQNAANFNSKNLPEKYLNDLKQYSAAFDHDELINDDTYRLAAYYYNRFLTMDNNGFKYEFESAINHFAGETRKMILFRLLKENIKKRLPDYQNYYERYNQLDKGSVFKTYIDSLYKFYQKPLTESILSTKLNSITGNNVTLKDLLAKHPGAVIYIDLWASWCIPCRAEFYFSEKLQANIKSSKIAFLYLSIDRDTDAWQNSAKEYTFMNKENSYIVNGDINAELLKQLKITTIPRYLIIDSNGYLIDDNAARPSDPKLREFLNKFL